jgi:uncharacterized repeat protein (TIGR03803 family)
MAYPHANRYRAAALAIALCPSAASAAAKFKTIYAVPGINDGSSPVSGLVKFNGIYYGTTPDGGGNPQGVTAFGTIFSLNPATGQETILHNFTAGTDGAEPLAGMIAYNGLLYGTTSAGGPHDAGTVFSFDPSTGTEQVVYSFAGLPSDQQPVAPLLAYNGLFYGTTLVGGQAESGTIFSLDPATGTETTLYQFGINSIEDGLGPDAALAVSNGLLYGVTEVGGSHGAGTIFSFDTTTNAETIAYNFSDGEDGGVPLAPLLPQGNLLWGTASGGGISNNGTVFDFNPSTGALKTVYKFRGHEDGAFPEAGLTASGNLLYGASTGFNAKSNGTIFSIDPSSGKEKTLYYFGATFDGNAPSANLLADGDALIGTATFGGFANLGTIFSYTPASGSETSLWNFTGVQDSYGGPLLQSGKTLYGTATGGGQYGYGSVYALNRKSGAGTTLYSFKGGPDGFYPAGTLVDISGTLYGATAKGGANNVGTLYALNAGGTKTILYTFTGGNDGGYPEGGLTLVGQTLYGTTYGGGTTGSGTIFSYTPGAASPTTLYNFTGGTDGELPWAPLCYANNTLYGTTLNGGIKHNGAVFAYNLSTATESTLYDFQGGTDGATPFGGVILLNNLLYGTTVNFGGASTLYSLDPANGIETVLYQFNPTTSGQFPYGGLTAIGNTLYGTTGSGGANNFGTVFAFNPTSNQETTLYAFTGTTDSGIPQTSLLPVNGTLYGGTTSIDGANGIVFSLKP